MTALNFPNNPTLNQEFPSPALPGIPIWKWDGEKWLLTAMDETAPPQISVGPLAPDDAVDGMLWWDITQQALMIYYDDQWERVTSRAATALAGYIDGLQFVWLGARHEFQVTSGVCVADDASGNINLRNDMEITAHALWGSGGNLDQGTVATGWYHVFAIDTDDFHDPSLLISLSPKTPQLPPNYSKKRRVFSYLTGASPFYPEEIHQFGDHFRWSQQMAEGSITNSTLERFWVLAKVPNGIITEAILTGALVSGASNNLYVYFSSPLFAGLYITGGLQTLYNATDAKNQHQFRIYTNTSQQVRYQGSHNIGQVTLATEGWIDSRGKDKFPEPPPPNQMFRIVASSGSTGFVRTSVRTCLYPPMLHPVTGNQLRIRIKFNPGTNGTLVDLWVGHRAATHESHFDGSQIKLTFHGGQAQISVVGGEYVSDPISFPTYDHTRTLVISMYSTGTINYAQSVAIGRTYTNRVFLGGTSYGPSGVNTSSQNIGNMTETLSPNWIFAAVTGYLD